MKDSLQEIINLSQGPGFAVSLYQSTSRRGKEKDLGPIQFKNLLRELVEQFETKELAKEARPFLEKLEEIRDDVDFWNHRKEGLALFARGDEIILHDLMEEVQPLVSLQNTLHLLPLIKAKQGLEQHFILEPSKDRYQLYFGTGSNLIPIKGEVAQSFEDLYDDLDANADVNFGSYQGAGTEGAFHGHRAKPEQEEIDKEKYFRYLDDTLGEFFAKHGFRVIVGGTKENIAQWMREVEDKPYYLEQHLNKPIRDYAEEELLEEVRNIFKEESQQNLKQKIESVQAATSSNRASTDRNEIKTALSEAKVKHLFIREDYHEDQIIELDNMVVSALNSGAEVHIVPVDLWTLSANIAAEYRY